MPNAIARALSRRAFLQTAVTAAVAPFARGQAMARQQASRIGLLLGDDAAAGQAFVEELTRLGYGGDRVAIRTSVLAGGTGVQAIADAVRAKPDLLVLQEEGRLLLNDPVSNYLPELGLMSAAVMSADGQQVLRTEPLRRPLTLADLLQHIAGIPNGFTGTSEALKR